jgi:DNA polymerase-3 subunit epsilon
MIMFDISNARFAFLDLETTGLSPWFGDRVCEVGIVISEGKRIKQQVSGTSYPNVRSPGAAARTDLSMRTGVRAFADVASDVMEWLSDTAVVCHNANSTCSFR